MTQTFRVLAAASLVIPLATTRPVQDKGADRTAVLDSVASLLASQYVAADTGASIGAYLRARGRAGAYDSGRTDSAFAALVTRDMRAVNGDWHLTLRVAGPTAAPSAIPPSTPIGRVELLHGNVGFIELRAIPAPTPENMRLLGDAMNRLAPAKAIIIDLRRNPGGAGQTNDTLWSYFVPDSQATASVEIRSAKTRFTRFVKPRNSAPHFPRVPMFLLTSRSTGSAAEGFAFFLQQIGRAVVVGEQSVGGGHLVTPFQVGSPFTVMISTGRVRNARTGREWEREGVIPDVPARAQDALAVAHLAAIDRLRAATTGGSRALDSLSTELRRQLPPPSTPAQLTGAAGELDTTFLKPYRNAWQLQILFPGASEPVSRGKWTDLVERTVVNGQDAWSRTQVTTMPASTTVNVFDATTFLPIVSTYRTEGALDDSPTRREFRGRDVVTTPYAPPGTSAPAPRRAQTERLAFDFYGGMYGLLLAALPLEPGYTAVLPVIDAVTDSMHELRVAVRRREPVRAGYLGTVDAWVVDVETTKGWMTFWLSKSAPYVIRLRNVGPLGAVWTWIMTDSAP